MKEKIVFVSGSKIGVIEENTAKYLNSHYLKQYNKNQMQIKNRNAWKTEGSGAAFMGAHNPYTNGGTDGEGPVVKINSITTMNEDAGRVIYSICISDISGIFKKSILDDEEEEGHIIHNRDVEFSSMDFDNETTTLVVSARNSSIEKHIALLDPNTSQYHFITEGDSVDDNPSYSRTKKGRIYYDSCGIGVDNVGNFLELGERSIYEIEPETGELNEIVSIHQYDCFKPKEDGQGNVYFIKRPHGKIEKERKIMSLKDIALIPFKLMKAIFNWMDFFTRRYTGDALNTAGQNPAKTKQKSEEQIFVDGNLINAQKVLEESKQAGEKFPGIAPRDWELSKLCPSGEIICVKRGVIDFDVNKEGEVVYSNGKWIIKVQKDGTELNLCQVEMATNLKVISI